MHAVVRRYRGASALNDLLAQRSQDVEQLLRDVPGFVAYYAFALATSSPRSRSAKIRPGPRSRAAAPPSG